MKISGKQLDIALYRVRNALGVDSDGDFELEIVITPDDPGAGQMVEVCRLEATGKVKISGTNKFKEITVSAEICPKSDKQEVQLCKTETFSTNEKY